MPIRVKPESDPKPARVYPLSQKDRDEVNKVFDKMHAQGKMNYSTQSTPYSYPVFMVWRTMTNGARKGRIVMDIQGLN